MLCLHFLTFFSSLKQIEKRNRRKFSGLMSTFSFRINIFTSKIAIKYESKRVTYEKNIHKLNGTEKKRNTHTHTHITQALRNWNLMCFDACENHFDNKKSNVF